LFDTDVIIRAEIIQGRHINMAAKFELYKDAKGEFRWRLVTSNGQAIASSGEGYKTIASAKAGIESVKK
jgi:uncharacterized protein YegP (UPF0339 family)